jgi:hypothetical protein
VEGDEPGPGTLEGRPLLLALVPPDPVFAAEVLAAGADLVLTVVGPDAERFGTPSTSLEQSACWLASLPRDRAGVVVDALDREIMEPWLAQHAPRHVVVGPRSRGELDTLVRSIGAEPWHLDLALDEDDAVEWIDLGWTGAVPDLDVATLVSVLENLTEGWDHTGTEVCDWTLPDLARAARHHRLLLSVDRPSARVDAVLAAVPAVRGFWVRVSPDADGREPTYAYAFGHEVGVEEVRTLAARLDGHRERSHRVGADGVEAGRREQIVRLHLPVERVPELTLEHLRLEAVRLAEVHGASLERLTWSLIEPRSFGALWAAWEGQVLAAAVRRWAGGLGVDDGVVTVAGPEVVVDCG